MQFMTCFVETRVMSIHCGVMSIAIRQSTMQILHCICMHSAAGYLT